MFWRVLKIGYPAYIIYVLLTTAFVVGTFFLFKNKSDRAKKWVILSFILLNVLQHFFKHLLWPHLWAGGFTVKNTAYNLCACMICLSPFAHLGKNQVLKQFIAYIGSIASAISLLCPIWYFGRSIFSWDFARFWCCHALLLASSLLPVLWKFVKFNYRDFWKFGLIIGLLCVIIVVNDTVCVCIGLMKGGVENLYETLSDTNPMWIFRPEEGFEWLVSIIDVFTPDVFMGKTTGYYAPLLWYFIPFYFLISILGFIFGALLDKKRFLLDLNKLKAKFKKG